MSASEEGKKRPGFQKDELTPAEVPSKASCPKVRQQRTVMLKNTAEDGAKFLQYGPAFMTAEWRKEYDRRNTIESRNAMLKKARTRALATSRRAICAGGRHR